MVAAFQIPQGDRYQIVTEHKPPHLVVEDTGLGIPRTKNVVVVQMITRPREREKKERFYQLFVEGLQAVCGISPTVSLVENTDEDWSFGHGRAQFLTGEL